ncbi:MBG domain-containing protein [Prosthecobacter vanneervenii]|uniref:peptidylprolyl isomerase n=1 Tax=Prosthecobacter vanneervenii TaxID=48466 RepID=A0A7W7YAX9_9BACT|nr:MBG domain-containing protein [Prosthecobacter vanneervenii]MBB5032490.1 cyclophilin family peptidyl-prolyl cis-trans isomerase [Prosthecobacter vanneervenii]
MVSSILSLRGLRFLVISFLALFCASPSFAGVPNGAPAALGAAVQDSASVVYFSFDDNSTDETGFDFAYTVNGSGTQHFQVTSTTSASKGTVYVGLTLSAGTTYTFQVCAYVGAFNAGNSTSYTNTITVTPASFSTPVIATTTITNESTVRFAVVDNSYSEAGYFYEYNPASTGFVSGGNTGASLSNVNFPGLAPGTAYQFRIRGFQGTSASPTAYTSYSNTVSVTTPFFAPTGLTATTASESTVNLAWTDNSAAEGGYAVYYRSSGTGSYTLLNYTAANATSYSVTGLNPGTAYDFQVYAAYQSTSVILSSASNTATTTTKDGFTSRTYQPITYNQAFSYQATVSTASSRTSWSITGLPTGLTFNSSTGLVSGTPTVTGVFSCPMTATFSSGWTTNNTLKLRIIRAPAAPLTGTTISSQTLASGGNTSISLTDKFSDPDSESAVRLITNMGNMDFILYNTATPNTVTNFLSYVNNASYSGNYNGAVFHRSVPGFVIQGGGFKVLSSPNNFTSITTTASPTNEPGISNLTGTVAMAKLGSDPNSATDQFFVNLADNSSNLDNQNGGFTVFARVAGSGMTTANAIAALPTVSSTVNVDGTANTSLTNWPVTSGSTMDTTKMVTITSAAPVAVLSYSVTGNTNSSAVSASISGTNLQINGVAGGQSNVTVTATDLDGNTVSQTFAVTVNQAPSITSAAPSANGAVGSAYSFTYTATGYPVPTFSVTSGALPAGLTLSSAGVISGTCSTAGTYSGVVTATNSNGTTTQSFSITVPKLSGTVNLGGLSPTYDGTAKTATSTTTPSGLTVTYTYNGSSTAPTNAGTYTVVGTINDTNYQGSATGSMTIAKATATVSLGSLSPTYDGTAKSVTSTTTPNGLTVTYTYNGSSTAPTNAGSYPVVATINDTNYQGTANGTLTISKASGSISLGSLSQTYNGTARTVTSTTTPNGLTVTYTYNGSSSAPTNAGSYPIVATINDTNYQGTANGTLNVAQATASIALSGLTQVYDGAAKPVTAVTTPVGLTVNITYNGSSTAPSGFGSYTVAASISDTNYTGTQGGTLVIQGQSSSSWKSQHFTAGQISAGLSADNADPDGDGVKNLAEYAMGTDPLARNTPPQPTVDANGLTLIFTRPKALPDVTYSAESTDSFGSWNPVTLEVITDGPVQTVRARDTLSSGNTTRRFMRLIFGTP